VLRWQVSRLVDRARRRPLVTATLALGISALLFAAQARRPKVYERSVGVLITEGTFSADGRHRPREELLKFIYSGVFTSARLEELAIKYDLLRKLASKPRLAVERVRDRIDIDIWQDFFERRRSAQDPPPTVRVTISFTASDPETALGMARDLGQLVASTQTQREAERVRDKRVLAERAADRANSLHEEFERMRIEARNQPADHAYARLQQMNLAVQAADATSLALAADLVDAQLRERRIRQIEHLVQTVEPGPLTWQATSRTQRFAVLAAVSLALGAFLAVFLVGAFDPTVRDEQDLRRVRIPYLGTIATTTTSTVHEL
jgi:hypothetical protein